MSCDTFADAVVDHARGAHLGIGSTAAVEAHLEHCAHCRARFVRQAQLTAGLRALAASTSAEEPSAAVGGRLLEAFAEHHSDAARPASARGGRPMLAKAGTLRITAAAAAIVLTVGALAWWGLRGSTGPRQAPAPTAPPSQATGVPPTAEAGGAASDPQPEVRRTPPRVHAAAPPGRRAGMRVVRPEGFMVLPAALGLPDFESGEIVRVEIPIASLPTYGIEIPEASRGAQVEADLLVGQDGQPRAIRVLRSLDTTGGGGGL
jgi:hypothetical protein